MADFYYSRVFPNGATRTDAPRQGDIIIRNGKAELIGGIIRNDKVELISGTTDVSVPVAKPAPFILPVMGTATFAEIEADGLVYTAKKPGITGNNIKVVHKAYKSAHEAGVTVKGNIITVVLETDSKGNILTDADALFDIINSEETLPITIGIEVHSEIKAGEYKLAGGADAPLGSKGELRWDEQGLYLCTGEEWLTIKEF